MKADFFFPISSRKATSLTELLATRGQAGISQPEASPVPGLTGVTFQLGVLFFKDVVLYVCF